MAIEENLRKIQEARYGREVRGAIHDAIHDCYEDGRAGTTDLIAREQIVAERTARETAVAGAMSAITAEQAARTAAVTAEENARTAAVAAEENARTAAVAAEQAAREAAVANLESIKADKTQLASPFNFKGSCLFAELPTSGNEVNDTYYVTDMTSRYSWNGTAWYQSGMSEADYTDALAAVETAVQNLEDGAPGTITSELKEELRYAVERIPSVNFYNPDIAMVGYQIYSNGSIGGNGGTNYTVSGYVPCEGHESIKVTLFDFAGAGTANQYCFYDENKNPIGGRVGGAPINGRTTEIEVVEGAYYIAFQWGTINGTAQTVMVNDGQYEVSSFVPYGDSFIVLPSDETKDARGGYANLNERLNNMDFSEEIGNIEEELEYLVEKKVGTNRLDLDSFTVGMQMSTSGYFFENESIALSNPIYVEGASKLRYMLITGWNGTSNRALFYKDNPFGKTNPEQTALAILPLTNAIESPWDGGQGTQYELTVPADAKYFVLQISKTHYEAMKTYADSDGIYSQAQVDVEVITEFYPYGYSKVIVKPSDEVVSARGEYNNLGDRLDAIDSGSKNIKKVTYWGDSLTQGNQDGTGVTRASVLKSLLGDEYEVNNFGVGGEKSNAIASRQGGMNIVINPGVTIPGDGNYVTVDDYITDNWGKPITFGSGIYGPAYSAYVTVNPCYVNGVECTLYKADASSPVQIKRNQSGDAIVIERPTTIVTNGSNTFRNRIAIIWVGQNQGFDIQSPQELVEQIKAMIEWNGTDKYIVLGLGYETYTSYGWQVEVNKALKLAFGRHYIDVGAYLRTPIYQNGAIVSSYGMADNNLTPTTAEIELISEYKYPTRLLASDGFHFSQYGYKAIANLEYKRGKELGYWN